MQHYMTYKGKREAWSEYLEEMRATARQEWQERRQDIEREESGSGRGESQEL